MNIDFELYRIFYAVAEEGNITKASKNLNISQPAVSKHIKNLESQLGDALFIRTKRGVILTDNGKTFYSHIKKAITCINNAENEFMSLKELEKGTIKIGISASLTKYFLLKYINIFHNLFPNITIQIDTDSTATLKGKLKEGKIDLIIARIPSVIGDGLDVIKLGKLNQCFFVNKDFLNITKKELNISGLKDYPILLLKEPSNSRSVINDFCLENNVQLNSIMDVSSSSLLIDFVKIGYGIGFITEEYIKNELKSKSLYKIKINPKIPSINFGIIKLKSNIISFSTKNFIKIMLEDIKKPN